MDSMYTRRPSNTTLTIVAAGVGALLVYALASPRRRAALLDAGQSALDAGSRLASTSADRIQSMLPSHATESAAALASSARSATSRATSAAAETLHDAVDRASALMHDVLARARELPDRAKRASHAGQDELSAAADDTADALGAGRRMPGSGAILAAAAIGAGLYAMQRTGTIDRIREKVGARGTNASGCIELQKSLYIDAPVAEVFDTWANYENFPRFMSNVQGVQPLDGQRSHWKVRGPAGIGVEWDAVTHLNRPNEVAWESEPGSTVQNEGRVTFMPEGNGTRATVHLSYRPPAGALGDAVSRLFGADPKREFEDDLDRMKQFVEGRKARGAASVSGTAPLQSI